VSREELIAVLQGQVDAEELPDDPVDPERKAMLYMQQRWGTDITHQLKWCASDSHACFNCPAAKAVACTREECDPALLDKVLGGTWDEK
jgi:hypothetical protein